MTHNDKLKAILTLRPGAAFSLRDDEQGNTNVEWQDEVQVQPTDEEIEAEYATQTAKEAMAAVVTAIQTTLDNGAKAKGYDNIISACTYSMQPPGVMFQAEGQAFVNWRTNVWATAYATLAQVQAGTVPMPTPEQAVAAMPAYVTPA
jgi:hypothetical protein